MTAELRDRLGRFGVWQAASLVTPELAVTLERLGYGTLWIGSSPDGDLAVPAAMLDATSTLMVGTSIVNIWKDDARTVARSYTRLEGRHPGRFVLGIGAGHREATQQYERPYQALAAYLDTLRAEGVPRHSIVLAALGPKVLRLSGDRAAGAIPYLVPPGHTRQARAILGPDALLAPEHKAVIDPDPARARQIGRRRVRTPYLGLVNYTSNLRRLGWAEPDLAGGGSDALIDALVAHGPADQVAARLHAHLEAGADHVAIQLLTASDDGLVPGYQELASSLSR
jgi:probable F420-dependent oxidoreductase